jgi:hypothetical protein
MLADVFIIARQRFIRKDRDIHWSIQESFHIANEVASATLGGTSIGLSDMHRIYRAQPAEI